MKTTLVIMAAGIGSRFGGGIKQLAPVGLNGEIIMDYSMGGRRIILSEICLQHGGVHLKVLQIFAEHSYWPFTRQ